MKNVKLPEAGDVYRSYAHPDKQVVIVQTMVTYQVVTNDDGDAVEESQMGGPSFTSSGVDLFTEEFGFVN